MQKIFGFVLLLILSACGSRAPDSQQPPNILYIIADDIGFTDLGSFGSEIPTPNLDELAYAGLRLTNLHTGPACRLTRLMLMSGARANHTSTPYPGAYRNAVLSLDYATMGELLQDAGYATYIAGKWDLGEVPGHTPEVRGFDRSFVEVRGSSSYFGRMFRGFFGIEEDGRPISQEGLPADFYLTDAFTDKVVEFIASTPEEQSWFAYLPYTAPHWPLQLPDDWLDRHAGRYDAGYDTLRSERYAGALQAGVIPPGGTLEQFNPVAEAWADLSADEQRRYIRAQEIYAGMVEYLDMSVGRVIDYLEESGQLDNTLIVYTADHGASGAEHGVDTGRTVADSGPAGPTDSDNRFENFGRVGSWIDKGRGFAEAATAPLKYQKGSLAEGGLRAASFVYFPRQVASGEVSHSFLSMMDLLPTFLEVAGTEHPGAGTYREREINGIDGRSAWSHFVGEAAQVHTPADVFGLTDRGRGVLIRDGYKIINLPPPGVSGTTPWQLYNISEDPGEHVDLAAEHPDLVAELVAEWEANWR